ncbi:hypothetical protein MF271_15170 [Deinococcus sp. KNUC1210]|uniref:hypothetical protein n=1 Tax=Deinococcus sp. KNUC1210 TaxID=2917691 RepID=UPI001EF01C1E|nr:hypothetical protein [Deinococcus sp. KNUC1210]ULH15268.1 hypothetical protein MF271_15170 [Deinococcus sp. KNUC1210]
MSQPPDPWKSAPVPVSRPPAAGTPALDAWGRPLLGSDPEQNRNDLRRSTARLGVCLAVLSWALLIVGVLSALGVVFGTLGVWRLLTLQDASLHLPPQIPWLLGLAGLLILVLYGLYAWVLRWARELIVRLGHWAVQGLAAPAPDAARLETLRRTLAGWLTFGQWGSVLAGVLGVLLVPISAVWSQRLAEHLGRSLGSPGQVDVSTSPAFIAFQTVSALLSSLPGIVITWLILGAVRRFMTLAVSRARGLTAPLLPAATTVSGWFLGCLILLGLSLLGLLTNFVLLGVFGAFLRTTLDRKAASGLPQDWQSVLPDGWANVVSWGLGALLVVVVVGMLVTVLLFCLLLWSRSYATALARELDARPAA